MIDHPKTNTYGPVLDNVVKCLSMSDPIYLINSRFIDIRRWYVLSENVLIYKWLLITLQIYTRDWLTTNQYGIVPATKLSDCCAKKNNLNSNLKQ